MVAMLIDHIAQHASRLLLVTFTAEAAATPRDLFPHEQTEFVAQVEDRARLLEMSESDKVCAEVLYQPHLFAHEIVCHRRSHAGVILVTLRAANQQPLTIEFEWSAFDELERTQAETFDNSCRAMNALQSHGAAIQRRRLWRPQGRPID